MYKELAETRPSRGGIKTTAVVSKPVESHHTSSVKTEITLPLDVPPTLAPVEIISAHLPPSHNDDVIQSLTKHTCDVLKESNGALEKLMDQHEDSLPPPIKPFRNKRILQPDDPEKTMLEVQ